MDPSIPLAPEGELSEWKKRALVFQLRSDFPDAHEDLLDQAVRQAAALLRPGMNLMVLFASASLLVRNSS
jgi:hypothetical protein